MNEVNKSEVVYCCSCKKHDHDGSAGYCNYFKCWTNMSDYCCEGEKND